MTAAALLLGGLVVLVMGYTAGFADGVTERHRRRWPRGFRR